MCPRSGHLFVPWLRRGQCAVPRRSYGQCPETAHLKLYGEPQGFAMVPKHIHRGAGMSLPRAIHLAVLKDLRRQRTDAAKEFLFLIPYLRNRRRDDEADELVRL
jgi:hypothetical protein